MGVRGASDGSLRAFLGGVLWILRTGAPWRDLPVHYGKWNTVFRRFRRWVLCGRWAQLLHAVGRAPEPDEVLLLDSTIVKAHPDAAGARASTADAEALGRSRGGFTTKIHTLITVTGRWAGWVLTPGQRADVTQAIPLLDRARVPRRLVADRAYDCRAVVAWCDQRGVEVVIPSCRGRRYPRILDRTAYSERNVIERFYGRLKRFRRVGTRTDKTASSFGAFVELGARAVERTSWV